MIAPLHQTCERWAKVRSCENLNVALPHCRSVSMEECLASRTEFPVEELFSESNDRLAFLFAPYLLALRVFYFFSLP